MQNKMENEDKVKSFLINFFSCIIQYEKKLIVQRSILQQLFCFDNPFGYFLYLDKNKKNYLNYDDFNLFLSNKLIKYKSIELKEIIKLYDYDNDHCWNFDEFQNFIENKKFLNTFYSINRIKQREFDNALEEYENELVKLFKIEIEYIEYLGLKIKALKDLTNSNEINTKIIFNNISNNRDKIDSNNLFQYLSENNKGKITSEDIKLIIYRISKGKNNISIRELNNMFKYDRFLNDKEITYIRTEGYHKTDPIDNTKLLYYNTYTTMKK